MADAAVKVGDAVLYIPDFQAHGLDMDHQRDHCFHFVHAADKPSHGKKQGDPADPRKCGKLKSWKDGVLLTEAGFAIRPTTPKRFWPAVVAEVFPDGTARIDVPHPCGCYTLHYRVPHDGGTATDATTAQEKSLTVYKPHTFHLAEGK